MPFMPQRRTPAQAGRPVCDPANWTAADLAGETAWIHALTPAELTDLRAAGQAALQHIDGDPGRLLDLGRDAFDLGRFALPLARIRRDLKDGLGLALIRGLPAAEMPQAESAAILWGIGRHLGKAISNNPDGDLIGHVHDTGKSYDDPNVRGYQTAVTMDYHCDQAELVALFCLRTARSGGLSKVASSVAVYNTLLARRPDLVAALMRPLCWTKHGEDDPAQRPWYDSPVFAFKDGLLCTAFGPKHIEKGHALPGAPPLTAAQAEGLRLAEEIAGGAASVDDPGGGRHPAAEQRGDAAHPNRLHRLAGAGTPPPSLAALAGRPRHPAGHRLHPAMAPRREDRRDQGADRPVGRLPAQISAIASRLSGSTWPPSTTIVWPVI